MRAPPRRGLVGWLLLLPIAAMLAFYGYVAALVANPHVDEAYRRTFLTGEFAVYPTVDSWKPGNGLDYRVGAYLDFRRSDMRQWLSRSDWHRMDTATVTLRGASGRLFLHMIGEPDVAARRHKLTVDLVCRLSMHHASEIEVSVNGRVVGSADCGDGAVTIEADLPAGSLGGVQYDEITISRAEGSVFERIATRLGFRAQAVELTSLSIEAE
jgi:hypothetical protein